VASEHYDVAPRAALDLARLLLRETGQGGSGDRQAPIEALELAARRGGPDVARAAGRRLAGMLQQPADPSRALQALTDATGSGDPMVASAALRRLGAAEALKLADELAAAGDVGRAETAYRLIADWEDQRVERARAAHRLAVLVADRDPEDARNYLALAVANATGPADRELLAGANSASRWRSSGSATPWLRSGPTATPPGRWGWSSPTCCRRETTPTVDDICQSSTWR
jgi:hypothetical protein